jgi:hypothetical protein
VFFCCGALVRYWHKAGMARQVAMSAFGAKANMRCWPGSRALIQVKSSPALTDKFN